MASDLGASLTPGQRCLLDLMQRKLWNTIQSYAKWSLLKDDPQNQVNVEPELQKLKEKIRRISARQKRFTLEIINGNGNNTIPKETFFEALGLITKEALNKLNSKTNERRRRTTANPRFSHEAIQAKKALEQPPQKKLEARSGRERRELPSRKSQNRQNQNESNNNVDSYASNNLKAANNNSNGRTNCNSRTNNQHHAQSNHRTNRRSASASGRSQRNITVQNNEERELLDKITQIQRKINTKVGLIREKQESNKLLERQNELIRKKGLDLLSAMNLLNPNNLSTFQQEDNIQQSETQSMNRNESLDLWIDMKCDESLDEID